MTSTPNLLMVGAGSMQCTAFGFAEDDVGYSAPLRLFYRFASQMAARCAARQAQHKYQLNAKNNTIIYF